MRGMIGWGAAVCALTFAASAAAEEGRSAASARQTLSDAWWTGPLLAPSAGTLPPGHLLFEPYLYDAIVDGRFDERGVRRGAPRADHFGSQSYLIYGLADRLSVGLIPRFGFVQPSAGPRSSGAAIGDVTLQAQYQLTQFREGSWVPTLAINVGETLPTGRFDRLDRASDGFGSGAWQTSAALYSQTYLWTPGGRILRARLDLTYSVSARTDVQDMSVYGTDAGFRGWAAPGDVAQADLGLEYSLTRRWVLALDLAWERDASTTVSGAYPAAPGPGWTPFRAGSGASEAVYLAPAVEYNFTSAVGVIVGARLEPAGRNTGASVTPVAAINLVY